MEMVKISDQNWLMNYTIDFGVLGSKNATVRGLSQEIEIDFSQKLKLIDIGAMQIGETVMAMIVLSNDKERKELAIGLFKPSDRIKFDLSIWE